MSALGTIFAVLFLLMLIFINGNLGRIGTQLKRANDETYGPEKSQ